MLKGISDEQLEFIRRTIWNFFPKAKILAFGSRVNGNPKRYSDLDICLVDSNPLSLSQWAFLDEAFEKSDLPIKVDISDYHRLTDEFKEHVDSTSKPL